MDGFEITYLKSNILNEPAPTKSNPGGLIASCLGIEAEGKEPSFAQTNRIWISFLSSSPFAGQ